MFLCNEFCGLIWPNTLIIINATYIINIPLNAPYNAPPPSLNCFNIGNFATAFARAVINLNIIRIAINSTIITPPVTMFIDNCLATSGNSPSFASFIMVFACSPPDCSSITLLAFSNITFSIVSSMLVVLITKFDTGLYNTSVTTNAMIVAHNFTAKVISPLLYPKNIDTAKIATIIKSITIRNHSNNGLS